MRTAVDGFPDDLWSESEGAAFEREFAEIERQLKLAPQIGREALRDALFNPSRDINAPLLFGKDPYAKLEYSPLN